MDSQDFQMLNLRKQTIIIQAHNDKIETEILSDSMYYK